MKANMRRNIQIIGKVLLCFLLFLSIARLETEAAEKDPLIYKKELMLLYDKDPHSYTLPNGVKRGGTMADFNIDVHDGEYVDVERQSGKSVKIKSVKSSNPNIVYVKTYTGVGTGNRMHIFCRGTGKAVVSFKVGKKTYKIKVTVIRKKKYIKKLVVDGKVNIADRIYKSTGRGDSYGTDKNKISFKLKMGSGAKIEKIECKDEEGKSLYSSSYLEKAFKRGTKIKIPKRCSFIIYAKVGKHTVDYNISVHEPWHAF